MWRVLITLRANWNVKSKATYYEYWRHWSQSLSKHEIQLYNYTGSSPSSQGTHCISSMNTKWLKACATTQSLPTVRITATSQMQYIVRPRSFINSKFRWYTLLPLCF